MSLSDPLSFSCYDMIAPINESHQVYLVRHQESGRLFVKKILSVYSADIYRKIRRHPVAGIPVIAASCEEDGRLIVIEEFISGNTLSDLIELTRRSGAAPSGSPESTCPSSVIPNEPLTIPKIGRYMIKLCEILERLHSLDPPVIHRDIKPSNIMVTACDTVVLLDLNAARYYSGRPGRSADTRLLGTHGYAAPEQYGFRESSPQTDLFAVGMTLKETVDAHPYEDHTFDAVIRKCTQMDPSKRYASAGALKAAIQRSLLRYERKIIPAVTFAVLLFIILIIGIFLGSLIL